MLRLGYLSLRLLSGCRSARPQDDDGPNRKPPAAAGGFCGAPAADAGRAERDQRDEILVRSRHQEVVSKLNLNSDVHRRT